ncbi:MAG: hypothetical protein Q4C79_04850 [Neisseria sp.]|uniref:hypothetical protein n=1 Tax=Neisseria sp. TaxID=192066 RepID=UPI0026DC4B5C|nr:hypothetical protein [Neisseria sp.]MDO4248281.1 hypothetical protein [Neisseria sp.]
MNFLTSDAPVNKIEKIWMANATFFIEGLAYLPGYNAPDYRYLHKHIKFRNLLNEDEAEFVLGTVPKKELGSQPHNGKNYNYTAAGTATIGFKGIDIGFLENGIYEIQISVSADKDIRNYAGLALADAGLDKHSADEFSEYRLFADDSKVYLAKRDIFGRDVPSGSHISVENFWADGTVFHVEGEFIVPDAPLSNFTKGKYYLIAQQHITKKQYVFELGQVRKNNLGAKIGKSTDDYNASYFATLGLKGIETHQLKPGIYDLYVSLAYGNKIFTAKLDKQLNTESLHACTLVNSESPLQPMEQKLPNDPKKVQKLAELANQQKDWRQAAAYSIHLQYMQPDMWQGYWWAGNAYKNMKQYDKAEAQFKLMTEKLPHLHHGLEGMVSVAQQQNQWEEVISRSYKFREGFPNLWHSYWWAGHAYKNLSLYEEARNEFRLLQKLSPESHRGLEGLVNVYQYEQDWKSAAAFAEKLFHSFPNLPVSYALLITSLKGNNQIDNAIQYAQQFVGKFPELELAHRYLAVTMCQNFDFDAAYPYYENYLNQFGRDKNNEHHVIYLKQSLGLYEDVLAHYKQKLPNPNTGSPYSSLAQLAKISQCLNDYTETIKYWDLYRKKWIQSENTVTAALRNSTPDNKPLNILIHEKLSQNLNEEAKDLFESDRAKLEGIDVLRFSSWFDYLQNKQSSNENTLPVVKNTIQSLWIGNDLGIVQQLCLASYLYHGHEVHLYCYQNLKNIPKGVVVKDGNEILPEKDIFYSHGSPAHFSDWFRWKMIAMESGYWVDMDEICLKPFDFTEDYVFGYEGHAVANAVLKFPSHHHLVELMEFMSQNPNQILPWDTRQDIERKQKRIQKGLGREHTLWGESSGPTGLTKALLYFNMDKFAKPYYYFYGLNSIQTRRMLLDQNFDARTLSDNMYAMHVWNNTFRKTDLYQQGKNVSNSILQHLIDKYQDFM